MALTDSLHARTRLVEVVRQPARPKLRRAIRLGLTALTAALAAVGAFLSFVSRGELWLDEAQTVAISRLPLDGLFTALREDGSPPLYYVVLHGWMAVWGESTTAVRLLSAVFTLAALPAMWVLARRLAGARAAWAAITLLATSPFAIRYGSETRMYSLVILLVLLEGVAVERALRRPSRRALALVALGSAALLLTHYWALYLIAAAAAVLLVEGRRHRAALAPAIALLAGGAAFVPWLPTFWHQMRSTGAPWAGRPSLGDLVDVLHGYGAPDQLDSAGWSLWLLLIGLTVLGVCGRRRRSGAIELRWRGQGPERGVGAIVAATLTVALIAGMMGNSPVTGRYTAVVFPLVMLLAAIGLTRLSLRAFTVVLAIAAFAGIHGGLDAATAQRTAAPRVAATINRLASPDDLVVYCPDQLGPSTSRLVDHDVAQVTFPSFAPPQRVDWDDYLDRIHGTDVDVFAREVDAMASGDVWLVTAPNYLTTSDTCRQMREALEELRPNSKEVVPADGRYFEQAQLFRLRPVPATS